MMDDNGLVYLRARYYDPGLGVFPSLDPVENLNRYLYVSGNPVNDAVDKLGWMNGYSYVNGNPVNDAVGEPMSLNRYSYVAGNPTNLVDPSGMIAESPRAWDNCSQMDRENCDYYRQAGDILGFNAEYIECLERNRERQNDPENPEWACKDRSLAERNRSAVLNESKHVISNVGRWVLLEHSQGKPDPDVKTRGVMLGGEASAFVSAGAAISVLFEINEWDAIWTNKNPKCGVFFSFELGLGTGLDPFQFSLPALVWSTAPLSRVSGSAVNASGDLPRLVGGIAESNNAECDYTAFASFSGAGVTISGTMGYGIEIPLASYLCATAWQQLVEFLIGP